MAETSEATYEANTVSELQDEIDRRGLSRTGLSLKSDLIDVLDKDDKATAREAKKSDSVSASDATGPDPVPTNDSNDGELSAKEIQDASVPDPDAPPQPVADAQASDPAHEMPRDEQPRGATIAPEVTNPGTGGISGGTVDIDLGETADAVPGRSEDGLHRASDPPPVLQLPDRIGEVTVPEGYANALLSAHATAAEEVQRVLSSASREDLERALSSRDDA